MDEVSILKHGPQKDIKGRTPEDDRKDKKLQYAFYFACLFPLLILVVLGFQLVAPDNNRFIDAADEVIESFIRIEILIIGFFVGTKINGS